MVSWDKITSFSHPSSSQHIFYLKAVDISTFCFILLHYCLQFVYVGRSWPNKVWEPLWSLSNQESKMEQKSLLFKESLVLSTELHLFTWTTKVESGSHRVTRAEECLHLGKESYAKSWFRVYKVCIIGRAKRSQQHPVFQGGQPAKYLMTGLNIVYLQWSDENWCQCDMAVASETLNFRKKIFWDLNL